MLYPYILISQVYTSRVEEIWASRNRETYISLYVTSFKKKDECLSFGHSVVSLKEAGYFL